MIANTSTITSKMFISTSTLSEMTEAEVNLDNQNISFLLKMNEETEKIIDNKNTAKSLNPWWFLFLLIPVLILPVCFCINGRALLMSFHNRIGILVCSCLRKKERTNDKLYDATICYSLFDQNWIEEEFLPSFSDHVRGYKINKLGKFNFIFKYSPMSSYDD